MDCGRAEVGDAKPMPDDYYGVRQSDLPGLDFHYQRILIE